MSSTPKVFVTRAIPEEGLRILREVAEVQVWTERLPPPRENLLDAVSDVDGLLSLLTDEIDAHLLDQAPRLKGVANYAVGYDNIDVTAATERGIWVTNTPGVLTEATADFSFALLLGAARRLVEADAATRAGDWLTWEPTYMLGADVHGKTLGIVGMGRIGRAVARRAAGFAMRILYADPSQSEEMEQALGAERVDMETLLAQSDFISLHAPLTQSTRALLDRDAFHRVKPGVIVINTARGELIDEKALVEALDDDRVRYAGLDVYAEEPLPRDHPLVTRPNAILAPHLGSATVGARRAMAEVAATNLRELLCNRVPPNAVNEPSRRHCP